MNSGKRFEQCFSESIPNEIYFIRIKDSANNFGRTATSHFATVNPYDFLLFENGYLFPMELKSTKSTSISIQMTDEKGKDIKRHQIISLTQSREHEGVLAGFLFDFRNERINKTYWMDIRDFNEYMSHTTKKSINPADIVQYHGIEVNKTLLRVRYKYDVVKLLADIVERGE